MFCFVIFLFLIFFFHSSLCLYHSWGVYYWNGKEIPSSAWEKVLVLPSMNIFLWGVGFCYGEWSGEVPQWVLLPTPASVHRGIFLWSLLWEPCWQRDGVKTGAPSVVGAIRVFHSVSPKISLRQFIKSSSQVSGPQLWPLKLSALDKQMLVCFIELQLSSFSPYFIVAVCSATSVFLWGPKNVVYFLFDFLFVHLFLIL